MSALATVAGKSYNGKFRAKIDFPLGYLMFNHFWQSNDAILKDVSVTEIIVWW